MRRWPFVLLLVTLSFGCTRCAPALEECGTTLHGSALSEGLLILGELHGTAEAPAMALGTACEAAKREGAAWLGLEIPRSEQPAIDAYLRGGSKEALLKSPFWTRGDQDGRSSQAMFALLEGVRRFRKQGLKLEIIAFDIPLAEGLSGRDERMAEHLRAARDARPEVPGVILVGGGHATRRLALPKPMAWHLDAAGVPFLTLDMAHAGGTAWLSGRTTGGADPQAPRGPAPEHFTEHVSRESPGSGFDGWWFAGTITASPPAITDLR
jgi:hypothetical protein